MMLEHCMIDEAAALLAMAQADCAPIGQLTQCYPAMTVADAYAIQRVNLAHRLNGGRVMVGHKIGLTSEPMQTLLGVNEPDFGYILDDMVMPNGAAVARDRFCAPRVEPEVAFLLCKPLRGPGVGVDDVRAATEAVAVALEIVDSRIADWKLTLSDTVADNASSGAVVFGDWVPYTADIDLPGARASLQLNGTEVDSGLGSAVLGDPAAAVA
ncbi:MAG TPA: fumarylacetoacetate hydrolase family protein, partial [Mycobacterium sp.]|nr:fumarylacetoacetate hydrolase family protein [Mycobacterium sp.]